MGPGSVLEGGHHAGWQMFGSSFWWEQYWREGWAPRDVGRRSARDRKSPPNRGGGSQQTEEAESVIVHK